MKMGDLMLLVSTEPCDNDGIDRTLLILDEPKNVRDLIPLIQSDWMGVWALSPDGSIKLRSLSNLQEAYVRF